MRAHHQDTIQNTINYFRTQPNVQALLLGGSVAHGFAQEFSDVDIMIIIPEADYQERLRNNDTTFFSRELCTYPEGYVDGKYVSTEFMSRVEAKGSEPARYAFADTQILFSDIPDLAERLARVTRYPVEEKTARLLRFQAQFEAWNWFVSEGFKKQNPYLIATAVNKLVLFGGRMLLAHNELLYPFHKWLMAVLAQAPDKPEGIVEQMQSLIEQPTQEKATAFYECIKGFREWEVDPVFWSNRFMKESELTWLDDRTVVDDI